VLEHHAHHLLPQQTAQVLTIDHWQFRGEKGVGRRRTLAQALRARRPVG